MHASKFTKFKFIVRDARVFPGIWFDFIYPIIQVYSLLLLRYMLQTIRIKFTTLSCFEANIYQRVFLRGRTHANKADTDRQTKFGNKHFVTVLAVRLIYVNPELPTNSA